VSGPTAKPDTRASQAPTTPSCCSTVAMMSPALPNDLVLSLRRSMEICTGTHSSIGVKQEVGSG
jgi:hypothetical protein